MKWCAQVNLLTSYHHAKFTVYHSYNCQNSLMYGLCGLIVCVAKDQLLTWSCLKNQLLTFKDQKNNAELCSITQQLTWPARGPNADHYIDTLHHASQKSEASTYLSKYSCSQVAPAIETHTIADSWWLPVVPVTTTHSATHVIRPQLQAAHGACAVHQMELGGWGQDYTK